MTPRGSTVFGRFEAGAPNVLWVADVLHGPLIGGKKAYLFAFLDDHSRSRPNLITLEEGALLAGGDREPTVRFTQISSCPPTGSNARCPK